MTDKEKPKTKDLTGGHYRPAEQRKQLADGSYIRLEDTTTPEEPTEEEPAE